jgi:hypothetical protein
VSSSAGLLAEAYYHDAWVKGHHIAHPISEAHIVVVLDAQVTLASDSSVGLAKLHAGLGFISCINQVTTLYIRTSNIPLSAYYVWSMKRTYDGKKNITVKKLQISHR